MTTITGKPGERYETTWGRKRTNSATFIGRIYLNQLCQLDDSGNNFGWESQGQVWACDHKHATEEEAIACADFEAHVLAQDTREANPPKVDDPAEVARRKQQILGDLGPQPNAELRSLADSVAEFFAEEGIEGITFE